MNLFNRKRVRQLYNFQFGWKRTISEGCVAESRMRPIISHALKLVAIFSIILNTSTSWGETNFFMGKCL